MIRMIRMTTDFFILTTEYTENHGDFSLAMRMIPKLLLSSVGTHLVCPKMRCFVFAGRTVARPYWWMFSSDAARYVPTIPTKDGKI